LFRRVQLLRHLLRRALLRLSVQRRQLQRPRGRGLQLRFVQPRPVRRQRNQALQRPRGLLPLLHLQLLRLHSARQVLRQLDNVRLRGPFSPAKLVQARLKA